MERSARDHREGGLVLVQGMGGVSIFAIQIASALGARIIATSSSDEKLTQARELGATDTINDRTTPDWAGAVLEMTDGRGVDMVIDVVVGDGLRDSIRAARGNSLVAVVGSLTKFHDGDRVTPPDLSPIKYPCDRRHLCRPSGTLKTCKRDVSSAS